MSDDTALRGEVSHFAAPDYTNPVDEAIDRALARSRAGRAPRRRGIAGVDPDDLPDLRDVADEYPAALGGPTSDTVADVMARVVWPNS